jgi:hypothetical protein
MSGFAEGHATGAGEDAQAPSGRGPRGGTTTVTRRGWVKKNLWMPPELAEQLRETAFRLRTSEADLIRRGVEALLGSLDRPAGSSTCETD